MPWTKIIEKEGNQQKLQKYKIAVNMCNAKRKPLGAPPPILTWTNTDAGENPTTDWHSEDTWVEMGSYFYSNGFIFILKEVSIFLSHDNLIYVWRSHFLRYEIMQGGEYFFLTMRDCTMWTLYLCSYHCSPKVPGGPVDATNASLGLLFRVTFPSGSCCPTSFQLTQYNTTLSPLFLIQQRLNDCHLFWN